MENHCRSGGEGTSSIRRKRARRHLEGKGEDAGGQGGAAEHLRD